MSTQIRGDYDEVAREGSTLSYRSDAIERGNLSGEGAIKARPRVLQLRGWGRAAMSHVSAMFLTSNSSSNSNTPVKHAEERQSSTGGTLKAIFRIPRNRYLRGRRIPRSLRWWLWELCAVMLSMACLVSIAVIVYLLDNDPLSAWQHPVTPNALLSVLATIGKASIILSVSACVSETKWRYYKQPHSLEDLQAFDDASRGPWGSLSFLLKVKGRAACAALGAVIIITSLGYELSAQQLISFQSKDTVYPDDTATILQSNSWALDLSDTESLQTILSNAVAGDIQTLTTRCSTFTCHFPDTTSLGLCSQCDDISNATQSHCVATMSSPHTTAMCTFVPDNAFFPPVSLTVNGSVNYEDVPPYNLTASPSLSPYNADPLSRIKMAITRVELPQTTAAPNSTSPSHARVQVCRWEFCALTYTNTTIDDGKLTYSTRSTSLPVQILGRLDRDYFHLTSNTAPKITYRVQVTTYSNMWTTLWSVVYKEFGGYSQLARTSRHDGIPFAAEMHEAAKNISLTLNAMILSDYNEQTTVVHGQAVKIEPYIHVRWVWLTLPVTLTLLATVLLAICMRFSMSSNMMPLKSSSLALLFYGLGGWSSDEIRVPYTEDPSVLEDMAKRMNVVFSSGEEGLKRFVKVE